MRGEIGGRRQEEKGPATFPTQYSPSFLGLGSLVCWVGITGHFPG